MTTGNVFDGGGIKKYSFDDMDKVEPDVKRMMEYVKGALDGMQKVADEKSIYGLSKVDRMREIRAIVEGIPPLIMTIVVSQKQDIEITISILRRLVNIFDDIIADMVDKLERDREPKQYVATAEAVLADVRAIAKEVKKLES